MSREQHQDSVVDAVRSGNQKRVSFLILSLVSAMVLTGCASTSQGVNLTKLGGPKVADTARYNNGNMRPYSVRGHTYTPKIPDRGDDETGLASWYGPESGGRTADGERFDPDGLSAAHKTYPLPSIAEVTNLENGKTLRVRINDRGPFTEGRIIDLSRGAAKVLGVTGTSKVRVVWLGPADPINASAPVYIAPAVSVPNGDGQAYIVQLGAFSDKNNAKRVQDQMDGAQVDQRNGLYIVYLGPYEGAAAAETHRQDAIDAGFPGAILKKAQ